MRRAFLVLAVSLAAAARADEKAPDVPASVRSALGDYLEASKKKEKKALERLLAAVEGDVALAAAAIRAHPPLVSAKPGTEHGVAFESRGQSWEYSVRLPKGYDGKKRFPALVLPDHGSVDARPGIAFWEGADDVERHVLFRPVIARHQEDAKRFPQSFFDRDQAMAEVMADALAALRLRYAVDPERLSMTGLSQAGYYTWYYGISFPDQFACLVPESAGGKAVEILPLCAKNLASVRTRILHAEGDQVTPYADATRMRDAIAAAGGAVELITYRDSDYEDAPNPKRHPGPAGLRRKNVLPWAHAQSRKIPSKFTRTLRYRQQGLEGRFRIAPPEKPTKPITVACEEKDGVLTTDGKGVVYLVSPEDVVARRTFRVGSKEVVPKADLALLFSSFKALGDRERLFAAEIPLR